MTASTWILIAASFTLPAAAGDEPGEPSGPQRVTVTLKGGVELEGSLLRRNDKGLVFDLEYDVIHIPADRVVAVRKASDSGEKGATRKQGIYRTGKLESASIPDLVRRFGDAVVTVRTAAGLGSGFIISRQGHLITNYHVVEGEERISVTVYQRTEQGHRKRELKKTRILALDPLRDIALLRLDAEEAKGWVLPDPVVLSEQEGVDVGDLVFAVGNPLGLERSVTQGIVSSTTRTIGQLRFIQTDASINPGNSGGPLFNNRGEVVGIACAGYTTFAGLAFGIPVSDLVDFIRHREAYLYDPTQPQNGVKYLDPPYRDGDGEKDRKPEEAEVRAEQDEAPPDHGDENDAVLSAGFTQNPSGRPDCR